MRALFANFVQTLMAGAKIGAASHDGEAVYAGVPEAGEVWRTAPSPLRHAKPVIIGVVIAALLGGGFALSRLAAAPAVMPAPSERRVVVREVIAAPRTAVAPPSDSAPGARAEFMARPAAPRPRRKPSTPVQGRPVSGAVGASREGAGSPSSSIALPPTAPSIAQASPSASPEPGPVAPRDAAPAVLAANAYSLTGIAGSSREAALRARREKVRANLIAARARTGVGGLAARRLVEGGVYDGQWQNARPSGLGRMLYRNGSDYSGEWRDGARLGFGVMRFADGKLFEGRFVNGQPQDGVFWSARGQQLLGADLFGALLSPNAEP